MAPSTETITPPWSPWQSLGAAQQRPDYRLLYSSSQLVHMFTCVGLVLAATGQTGARTVLGVAAQGGTGPARTHHSQVLC